MRPLLPLALAAALCATTALAQAPVGWEPFAKTYDGNRPVLLTGEILTSDFSGLRAKLTLEERSSGAPAIWTIDGGAKAAMAQNGLNAQTLRPGLNITIRGYQAKDGSKLAMARDVTFADGRKVFVSTSGTGAPR